MESRNIFSRCEGSVDDSQTFSYSNDGLIQESRLSRLRNEGVKKFEQLGGKFEVRTDSYQSRPQTSKGYGKVKMVLVYSHNLF